MTQERRTTSAQLYIDFDKTSTGQHSRFEASERILGITHRITAVRYQIRYSLLTHKRKLPAENVDHGPWPILLSIIAVNQDLNTRLDDRIDNHIELNEFIGRNNA